MQKLYCYVDETGQDTQGEVFIVAIVVTEIETDELIGLCEEAEEISGKGKIKWGKAKHEQRIKYLRELLGDSRFAGRLRYCVFRGDRDYDSCTITAISRAVSWRKPKGRFTTSVYVDGLSKSKRHRYGATLRRMGTPVHQVRGVTRDESNALTRLADAVAGFVRDAMESRSGEVRTLFERATRKGRLKEV